jgi:hypothetical protein
VAHQGGGGVDVKLQPGANPSFEDGPPDKEPKLKQAPPAYYHEKV